MTNVLKESPSHWGPIPNLGTNDSDSSLRKHFEAATEQRVCLPWCTECENWRWPLRSACIHCQGSYFEWRDVNSVGRLLTYTEVRKRFYEGLDDATYLLCVTELENGAVRMLGRLRMNSGEVPQLDMKVKAFFHHTNSSVTLIGWEPFPRLSDSQPKTQPSTHHADV